MYLTCPAIFSDLFPDRHLSHALFTGTASPHRKTAIQIMDSSGEIQGFAKASADKSAGQLVNREKHFLDYARSLGLRTANIPKALLNQEISGTHLLVTDTEKTRHSKSPVAYTRQHQAFLTELAAKSRSSQKLHNSQFLRDLIHHAAQNTHRLPAAWNTRLTAALQKITRAAPALQVEMAACHGDFTPWNTFIVGDKLYVFDWEYAHKEYPPGYDLIHFHLSLPANKRQAVTKTTLRIMELLEAHGFAPDSAAAEILLLCYLCAHSLHYISREPAAAGILSSWPGEQETAGFIDALRGINDKSLGIP